MLRRKRDTIEDEIFERQADICKAFAHPTRLHLLHLIGGGERGLSDIQAKIGVTKANLSQHLAVLKAAGVIRTRRSGKLVHVGLAIPEVKQACHLIHEVLRSYIRKQRKLAG